MRAGLYIALLVFPVFSGCRHTNPQTDTDKVPPASPYHIELVAVGEIDAAYMDAAAEELKKEFPGADITFYPEVLPAPDSLDYVPGKKSAEKILQLLLRNKRKGVDTFLGVTGYNIAVKERVLSNGKHLQNWSVLGLGSLVNGVCICSYKRLPKPGHFKKLVVHEFSHTLGLEHCPVTTCTLVDGDGSAAPIKQSTGLCDKCRLQAFHVLSR